MIGWIRTLTNASELISRLGKHMGWKHALTSSLWVSTKTDQGANVGDKTHLYVLDTQQLIQAVRRNETRGTR
jgi:hypothetical protein